jgi:metal-dependent hydrolase (beta-lactamase superfamily II)
MGEIIRQLQQMGVANVAPCHCTGDKARSTFERSYGQDYSTACVGW